MRFDGKRYWLVGASEGLGRALSHKLSAAGAELILSARAEDRLQSLADDLPGKTQVLPRDLTYEASAAQACAALGSVVVLVVLAGVCLPMS